MQRSGTIVQVDFWPLDVDLIEDFTISRGSVRVAQNVFVRVLLEDGGEGFGEVAPFPQLSGFDRGASLAALGALRDGLLGESVHHYRRLVDGLAAADSAPAAARTGLEMALLDALCRLHELPLWAFWGGSASQPIATDVTIPITDVEASLRLAGRWAAAGFTRFKIKVGVDPESDAQRVRRIAEAHPGVSLVLDANQGFTVAQALAFIASLSDIRERILIYEQPVAREDLGGLAAVRRQAGVKVAADESVRSVEDAMAVVRHAAADVINIKIMETGLLGAAAVAAVARAGGLKLMIGGMVETRLAMGCSLALAMGLGGFFNVDLDTPLFMAEDPLVGGYLYEGPLMKAGADPGLGMRPVAVPAGAGGSS